MRPVRADTLSSQTAGREVSKGTNGEAVRRLMLLSERRTDEMVERIRSLLARFSEDEESVRRLVAMDASFDALCDEYRKVIELLDRYDGAVNQLSQRRALLGGGAAHSHRGASAAIAGAVPCRQRGQTLRADPTLNPRVGARGQSGSDPGTRP
jgi:hypothetical protein